MHRVSHGITGFRALGFIRLPVQADKGIYIGEVCAVAGHSVENF